MELLRKRHPPNTFLGPPKSALKRHLDLFRRFCMAHERDQQTDAHTDRQTTLVTPSAEIAVMLTKRTEAN